MNTHTHTHTHTLIEILLFLGGLLQVLFLKIKSNKIFDVFLIQIFQKNLNQKRSKLVNGDSNFKFS